MTRSGARRVWILGAQPDRAGRAGAVDGEIVAAGRRRRERPRDDAHRGAATVDVLALRLGEGERPAARDLGSVEASDRVGVAEAGREQRGARRRIAGAAQELDREPVAGTNDRRRAEPRCQEPRALGKERRVAPGHLGQHACAVDVDRAGTRADDRQREQLRRAHGPLYRGRAEVRAGRRLMPKPAEVAGRMLPRDEARAGQPDRRPRVHGARRGAPHDLGAALLRSDRPRPPSQDARARVDRHVAGVAPASARERAERTFLDRRARMMVARTVEIDDAVRGAGTPQVVILGAGLDGRAWRMAELRDVLVFEVDHPDSQREKRARVGALTQTAREVRFVPVDFTRDRLDDALAAAGHDPDRRTTWIWEGVVMYLTPADVEATLAAIARRSARGSRAIVVYAAPAVLFHVVAFIVARIGEPFRSTFKPDAMRAPPREAWLRCRARRGAPRDRRRHARRHRPRHARHEARAHRDRRPSARPIGRALIELIGTSTGHRAEDLALLSGRWAALRAKLEALLGERQQVAVELDAEEDDELLRAIRGGATRQQLADIAQDWRLEPTARRLARIAEHARALAGRLDKAPIMIDMAPNRQRLDAPRWAGFWSSFIHAVRNAIDHGLEAPEERTGSGKSADGNLRLATYVVDERFVVELHDDGRGIDWPAVQRRAAELGLPNGTPADLREALFHDGLSTRASASELSGRGVGMGAVRTACHALGGRIELDSVPGHGTKVRFVFPAAATGAAQLDGTPLQAAS